MFFSSVTQSCPTLCDPMDCSTPGFPVPHQLLELTQTHIHQVSDAIQPSHPLPFPSPGDLPDPGIEPGSPTLLVDSLPFEPSIQFSSVVQSCPALGDCSTPGLSVHHQLPELTQTHVHQVGDVIQPP